MDMAAMLSELSDHGFEDTSTSRKVGHIQDTVQDIDSREPWPYLENAATLTLTAGIDTVTLPGDFRSVKSLVIPASGVTLVPADLSSVMHRYTASLSATGTPFIYYFVGNTLKVLWVPDMAYAALLEYNRVQPALTPTSLESEFLMPPRHHRTIVLGALSRLYAMEDDGEQAQYFDSLYEKRIAQAAFDLITRELDRPQVVEDVWDEGWV